MAERFRLVILSDTHGLHEDVVVPDGDVLVHAGDVTASGSLPQLRSFDHWLGGLPHAVKIVIAGNHDWCFQQAPEDARTILSNARYIEDERIDVHGVHLYGSPWQPWFMDWAFNLPRGEALRKRWACIPRDTDILITHGPPHGILDHTYRDAHVGCEELRIVVDDIRPPLHVFGHIHEGYGQWEQGGTRFVNASICDVRMVPVNPPVVVDWPL